MTWHPDMPDEYKNQIVTGDCVELMRELPDGSIDLVITSPPYDNLRDYDGYVFDFESVAAQLFRVLCEGGVIVWVVGDQVKDGSETGTSFRQALGFLDKEFLLHDTMIYEKTGVVPQNNRRYEQEFEYMFVFSKGQPKTFNPIMVPKLWEDKRKHKVTHRDKDGEFKYGYAKQSKTKLLGNIWRISSGGGHSTKDQFAHQHPAIFPEKLARDHISTWSNPGDVVFDPMCGSGTTLKMAKQAGRYWIGFDISEEYCEIARRRVKQAQPPLFEKV